MDLFKKVIPFKTHQEIINTTKHVKVYMEGEYSSGITRFVFTDLKGGKNAMLNLKQIKHPNILSITKSKDSMNEVCIKTVLLFPIKDFINSSISYQHHVMSILAEIIVFLKRCNLCHNGITMDNLYCNKEGRVVLAGFERAIKEESMNDDFMFFELMKIIEENIINVKHPNKREYKFNIQNTKEKSSEDEIKSQNVNIDFREFTNKTQILSVIENSEEYQRIEDFISNNQEFHKNNIYTKLEHSFIKFQLMSYSVKIELVDFIIRHRMEWVEPVKNHILKKFMTEITAKNQDYKTKILTMFFSLEIKNYDILIENLFSQRDSVVRFFLLQNIDFYRENIPTWNGKIFDNLILGLKCNDFTLQFESIKFINKISKELNDNNIKDTIRALQYGSTSELIIDEGISFIDQNIDRVKKNSCLNKETYRIIFIFMNNDARRGSVIGLLSRVFDCFECKKLQKEILPALCNYLSDEMVQDLCFEVIADILSFLKENKSKIIKTEWSVKSLGTLIKKIPNFSSKESTNSKESKDGKGDWSDNW